MSEVVKPSGEPLAKIKKATSNFRGGKSQAANRWLKIIKPPQMSEVVKPSGEPLAKIIKPPRISEVVKPRGEPRGSKES